MRFKIIFFIVLMVSCRQTVFSQAVGKNVVPAFKAIFTAAPKKIPTAFIPDAALAGNGDIGIVLGGTPAKQTIYIAKNDCWKAKPGYPDGGLCLPGGLNIDVPELEGASFYAEQALANGNIKAIFTKNEITCTLSITVPSGLNMIILEMTTNGAPCTVSLSPWAQTGFDSRNESGEKDGVKYVTRNFDSPGLEWPTHVALAVTSIGAKGTSFVVNPASSVTVVVGVCSNHENADYLNTAVSRAKNATIKSVEILKKGNDAWWQKFWSKSQINIGDSLLEKYYYGSLYLLASCSRNNLFPPGLCGNSITADALTAWQGDYHTNYNYEAPWWGCYSSNHIELTNPYDAPILDYMPRAKINARKLLKTRGVYFPVGLGPKGFGSTLYPLTEKKMMSSYGIKDVGLEGGEMFCGQRSNAVFLTVNMFQRFYHTYDKAYAQKVYPFIKEVADFWEDYLKFENDQYNSYNDNFWEVGPWAKGWRADMQAGDTNNTLTLGLLKMFYKGISDMSVFLKVDSDKREKWQHIQQHLYPVPLYKRGNITRVKATERGTSSGNEKRTPPGFGRTMAYAWVFPSGVAGMRTDPVFADILLKEVGRWDTEPGGDPAWDNLGNGFETYFTTAVRVGYDPEKIIKKLKERIAKTALPNLWVPQSGGLTETLSAIPSCIDEMLLQGYEGMIRLFPAWPMNKDASFSSLRTYGAFLVSAEKKNGRVETVKIVSEKGNTCTVENPWATKMFVTTSKGAKVAATVKGNDYTFATKAGLTYLLKSK